jgi:hypothetical protein
MKKKVFSIIAIGAIALTSCNKDEVLDSNQLGEAVIKGNIYANLDETNDVNSAGLFALGSNPESVEGLTVSVTIDTKDWDQSPDVNYNYPEKTYTAITDANGDYTLTMPATDKPSTAYLSFGNLYTTQSKFTTDGSDLIEDVKVGGNYIGVQIFSGANVVVAHEANMTTVYTANNEYGTGKLRMKVKCDVNYGPNSTQVYDDLTGSSLIGQTVEFTYRNGYQAPDGTYNNNSIFTATILLDPTDNTSGLIEVDVPTFPTGGSITYVTGNYSDFQGTVKKDDGLGNEITQNAIYNLGGTYYMPNLSDGGIETYGTIYITTTEN